MAVNYGYDLSEESDWFTANITLIGKRPFPCSSTVSPPSLQISPDWSSGRTTPPCPSLPSSWMASSTSPPAHPRRRWTAVEEMVSVKCHFAKKKKKKNTRQGQSIHQSICKQFKLRVCQRSTPVKRWSINQCQSVSCQTANRLIRTPNSPVKTINESVFLMRSASALWGYLSDGSLSFNDRAVNAPRKYGVN